MTQPLDLARTAAELTLDLHPLGTALVDCATHLAEMSDLLPARGDVRLEFNELVRVLAYIERLYHAADEKLTATAYLLQHAADVPDPLPLNGNAADAGRIEPFQSALAAPAHRPIPREG